MTKRLTITLVALALFVLIAVLPASAISANLPTGLFNGSIILNGTPTPTVFIGESGLNITRVIYGGLGDGFGGPWNVRSIHRQPRLAGGHPVHSVTRTTPQHKSM